MKMSRSNRDRVIFKTLMSEEEAKELYYSKLPFHKLQKVITVKLQDAYGMVLAETITADMDIPPFDRSKMDGYAVHAEDTYSADEEDPVELKIIGKIKAGDYFEQTLNPGEAVEISTGAPIPFGANTVVPVEDTSEGENNTVLIYKGYPPSSHIQRAGSDITYGETLVVKGTRLTQRETSLLAAIGRSEVKVFKPPIVGVISTGNEVWPWKKPLPPGKIFDINSQSITDSLRALGATPRSYGILPDSWNELEETLKKAISECDVVFVSGGTSAGVGDILYRIINKLGEPGILVHGVLVQPGKPTILALVNDTPLIGLPGFPTSSMVIFDLFGAPIILRLLGIENTPPRPTVKARVTSRIQTIKGRTQLLFVGLTQNEAGEYLLFQVPGGSGSISTLVRAIGYVKIPKEIEFLNKGELVDVSLLIPKEKLPQLNITGSQCLGLERILNKLRETTHSPIQVVATGSLGGLKSITKEECDISGIHILDTSTGEYNKHVIQELPNKDEFLLIRGYSREQGLILPKGNPDNIQSFQDFIEKQLPFINRNKNSGTRLLTDYLLKKIARTKGIPFAELIQQIPGYNMEANSHTAVGLRIRDGLARGGVGLKYIAKLFDLEFIPISEEKYDFIIRKDRLKKPLVQQFLKLIKTPEIRETINQLDGFHADESMGTILFGGNSGF